MPPRRLILWAFLAAACAPAGSSKRPFVANVTGENELMEADRDFARGTLDRGIDGWVDSFADDGVQLPPGEPIARGKQAIRDVMVALLTDSTNRLRWEPDHASVSAGGDLGYTTGHTTVSKVAPTGQEVVVAKLKYVTVWKRQIDGRWRVAAEIGNPEP